MTKYAESTVDRLKLCVDVLFPNKDVPGLPAEHRNMPVEDAIQLIAEDFRAKVALDRSNAPRMLLKSVPIIPAGGSASVAPDRHPDTIQK